MEEERIKILNLYAGIGGNRKLWPDYQIEVTAVEINPDIAKIYQDFFPNDKVIVTDAHKYLLKHYKEFDFIWSSPPCPTHSDIRRVRVHAGNLAAVYPDMKLYQEIILLQHFGKGKWVIENVISYYEPLIKPYVCGRHYFWSNFVIPNKDMPVEIPKHTTLKQKDNITTQCRIKGFDLTDIQINDKRRLIRNCVNPYLGLYIFNLAFKEPQLTLDQAKKGE